MHLGETPFLATHFSGNTAWVDLLFVPAPLRCQGLGRRLFETWARQLPTPVERIQLLAIALDGGSPVDFWRKLGFAPADLEVPVGCDGAYLAKPVRPAFPADR